MVYPAVRLFYLCILPSSNCKTLACVGAGLTAHIHDAFRLGKHKINIHQILMHTGTGGIGEAYIRTAGILLMKSCVRHILHIRRQRTALFLMPFDFRIDLGVFDGFGYVFDSIT